MRTIVDFDLVSHLINFDHVVRGTANRRSYNEPWILTLQFVTGETLQYLLSGDELNRILQEFKWQPPK